MSSTKTGAVLERIDELLEATYGSADLGNLDDPLAETIFILLSQQTRETVYREVFRQLRARYPSWATLMRAKPETIERILKPAGFQARRTSQLQSLLHQVDSENARRGVGTHAQPTADLTLDFLHDMTDTAAERFLTSLPGVGPKTARCVLAYSLKRSAFPVDTHVHRIFQRLGLVGSRGRKVDHEPFQALVPEKMRLRLHMNLVHHGRAICRSKEEQCGKCVLVSFCKTGKQIRSMASDPRPQAIDLFAGAGGLGAGFERRGFRIGLAVEADRHAAQTYRLNHPGVPVIERRIGRHMTAPILRALIPSLGTVRAVLAGPPCQGYSAAGSRQTDDPRNVLYREVVRIAREMRARFVVIENVPGIRQVGGTEYARRIEEALARAGYRATRFDLTATDFGVAQRRRRYFFVGRAGQGPLPLPPQPTHRSSALRSAKNPLPPTPSLAGLLRSLPQIESGTAAERISRRGRVFLNLSTMNHSARVVRKISRIAQGQGPISYRRLDPDAARTLIAGHRALPVHPSLNRTISIREAARIQGFPDNYFFCGPRAEQPLQVANAVPPPLAAAVAFRIRQCEEPVPREKGVNLIRPRL